MTAPNISTPWQISTTYSGGRKDGKKIAIICAPHPDGGGQNIIECTEDLAPIVASLPDLLEALELSFIHAAAMQQNGRTIKERQELAKSVHAKIKQALLSAGYTE
jgi:hypothetical protein